MRVLVLGAIGMLGKAMVRILKRERRLVSVHWEVFAMLRPEKMERGVVG